MAFKDASLAQLTMYNFKLLSIKASFSLESVHCNPSISIWFLIKAGAAGQGTFSVRTCDDTREGIDFNVYSVFYCFSLFLLFISTVNGSIKECQKMCLHEVAPNVLWKITLLFIKKAASTNEC